jgi:hypothetical protein
MTDAATDADRAHFRAIAEAEAESEDERFTRAAAEPPGPRMLAGHELGRALPRTPASIAESDARADGQMEIARRRVARGLGSDA